MGLFPQTLPALPWQEDSDFCLNQWVPKVLRSPWVGLGAQEPPLTTPPGRALSPLGGTQVTGCPVKGQNSQRCCGEEKWEFGLWSCVYKGVPNHS